MVEQSVFVHNMEHEYKATFQTIYTAFPSFLIKIVRKKLRYRPNFIS